MSVIVHLPGGGTVEVPPGLTAREAIAQADPQLAAATVVVRIDGEVADLNLTVADGSHVEAVTPSQPEALEVYRHSSAHLLAAAVLELYPGTKLGIGPALLNDPKGGFFYDFQR